MSQRPGPLLHDPRFRDGFVSVPDPTEDDTMSEQTADSPATGARPPELDGPVVCLRRYDPVLKQMVFEPLPAASAPREPLSDDYVQTMLASLRAAGRDEDGEVPEWFRPGFLLEVAKAIESLRTELASARAALDAMIAERDKYRDAAIENATENAEAQAALDEARRDTERLDWMQETVEGTGETMQFGGVCYWGIELKRGKNGKPRRLGDGNDLREAIDAARAARSPTQEDDRG